MKTQWLVFSERHPDGIVLDDHRMRQEVIRAKYKKEYVTTVEVSDDFAAELNEVLEELEY